jgi:hypothetical protein
VPEVSGGLDVRFLWLRLRAFAAILDSMESFQVLDVESPVIEQCSQAAHRDGQPSHRVFILKENRLLP